MISKIFYRYLFFLPLLFSLTSCFEVLEEVTLEPAGNGTFSLTLNMSQSKTQIDKLLLKDSVDHFKIPKRTDIENSLAELNKKLLQLKGISNVVITKNFENHIFSVKCNFTDVASLNAAINQIWKQYDKTAPAGIIFYSGNASGLNRFMDQRAFKSLKPKIGKQEKDVLQEATWTMVYRFGKEINTFTNKKATVSKSGKAIILKTPILPVVNGTDNIQNEIKLKP